MKRLIIIIVLLTAGQYVLAQSNERCDLKVSAANVQDGGIIIGSNYTVSLPSLVSPTPFAPGEPNDCAFFVSPTGLTDAHSFIQSDFQSSFIDATNATLKRTIRIKSVDLTATSNDPKLIFNSLRFYDATSLVNKNTYELLLVAKPGLSISDVNIGGIWRTNSANGTFVDRVAFPDMNFHLQSAAQASEFDVVWRNKINNGVLNSEIYIYRTDNGFYQAIYSATSDLTDRKLIAAQPTIVFPFSSTVGALSDSGLKKRSHGLGFITSFSCSQNGVEISCF